MSSTSTTDLLDRPLGELTLRELVRLGDVARTVAETLQRAATGPAIAEAPRPPATVEAPPVVRLLSAKKKRAVRVKATPRAPAVAPGPRAQRKAQGLAMLRQGQTMADVMAATGVSSNTARAWRDGVATGAPAKAVHSAPVRPPVTVRNGRANGAQAPSDVDAGDGWMR